uniref:(northern house mosquito) hypothetical protein n=1 Tax=Culex pipiens TaxID=7175 RepID=A0A8D8PHX8_CULPI
MHPQRNAPTKSTQREPARHDATEPGPPRRTTLRQRRGQQLLPRRLPVRILNNLRPVRPHRSNRGGRRPQTDLNPRNQSGADSGPAAEPKRIAQLTLGGVRCR